MKNTSSKHWMNDRKERDQLIKEIGFTREIKRVTIDRGHKDGAEIHVITDTALIYIFNAVTWKRITVLVARPGQLRRYWKDEEVPTNLIEIARKYQRMGYNEI